MAVLTGLFTLGKDAELKNLASGDQVATLSIVYNYGRKQDGQQPSQWIRATLWGKRASSLAPYLLKGKQISAVLDDLNVREYETASGKGYSLEAKIVDLEFVRGGNDQWQQGQAPRQQPARQAPAQQPASSGFTDMDDCPF